jgi:hypothetical protein
LLSVGEYLVAQRGVVGKGTRRGTRFKLSGNWVGVREIHYPLNRMCNKSEGLSPAVGKIGVP